jgi:phage baseplate assembly protein W
MPLENISRGFKDISLSFLRHPVTNDVAAIYNEDAIKKSVVNLVRTRIGERFFNSILGSNIEDSLFELTSSGFFDPLQEEITILLNNFEPRINLKRVNLQVVPDDNELNVSIIYDIVGLAVPTQAISFILQPTRY